MSVKEPLPPLERRVLKFFREHPQAVETERGIATWLGAGEEAQTLSEVLRDLVRRKWLTADETSAITGYALTRDERLLSELQEELGAP